MQYSASEVKIFEVTHMTQKELEDFNEFLRSHTIHAIMRPVNGGSLAGKDGECYYTGVFTRSAAKSIKEWLKNRSAKKAKKE